VRVRRLAQGAAAISQTRGGQCGLQVRVRMTPSAARECAVTSFRGEVLASALAGRLYFVTSNLPKIPSLSMFGPAVKYKEVLAALLLPLPKTSAHSPSTFSALPFLSAG
jgi:hypothetical protein